jgi:uncharacterized protein (TIGR00255 family)
MTGFGRGEKEAAEYKIIVEIKTVNHRYLDLNIRLPQVMNVLEERIRKAVSATLFRGRTDIFISLIEKEAMEKKIRVDKELAMSYHNALRDLSNSLYLPEPVDVYRVAQQPGVIQIENAEYDNEKLWRDLEDALKAALDGIVNMRTVEGENMAADLKKRAERLGALVESAEERAPKVEQEYRKRLKERVAALLEGEAEVDEARLVQETAIFADRANFTEELVRLKSHIGQFLKTLASKEGSVGRKLDFIVQEMNRETNTIASKANDFAVTSITVEAKSEIEKIREQIQNIE